MDRSDPALWYRDSGQTRRWEEIELPTLRRQPFWVWCFRVFSSREMVLHSSAFSRVAALTAFESASLSLSSSFTSWTCSSAAIFFLERSEQMVQLRPKMSGLEVKIQNTVHSTPTRTHRADGHSLVHTTRE